MRDLTTLNRLNAELLAAIEQAKNAPESRDEFRAQLEAENRFFAEAARLRKEGRNV
jgi:hypothetical protein